MRARSEVQPQVGIDVGGTKILGVLASPETGEIHRQLKMRTPQSTSEALASAIGDMVGELMEDGSEPKVVGVGLPGLVDLKGLFKYGPNTSSVSDLDIGSYLYDRFSVAVTVDNDATNAAVAEHRLGAAKGYEDCLIVTQGTGIGGGIVAAGEVVRGASGFAGELGHMTVDANGFLCACGRLGCWETVASGAGLVNLALELISQGRGRFMLELAGGDGSNLRGEHVSEAVGLGDSDAAKIVSDFATWTARGLGSLVSLLDPGVIVLGGGLTTMAEYFLDDVRERLETYTLGGLNRPSVPIFAAALGPVAGAIGGAIKASELNRCG